MLASRKLLCRVLRFLHCNKCRVNMARTNACTACVGRWWPLACHRLQVQRCWLGSPLKALAYQCLQVHRHAAPSAVNAQCMKPCAGCTAGSQPAGRDTSCKCVYCFATWTRPGRSFVYPHPTPQQLSKKACCLSNKALFDLHTSAMKYCNSPNQSLGLSFPVRRAKSSGASAPSAG